MKYILTKLGGKVNFLFNRGAKFYAKICTHC